MAAPDETAVDEQQPTNVDRLARFLAVELGLDADGEPTDTMRGVADAVLRDFFRVDVDAQHIFATPGVDAKTLEPFAMVVWGPMAGRLAPIELRSIAASFLETAETADTEATFVRWLMRDDGSNIEGAVKILQSFRQYRAALEETPAEA